MFGIKSLNQSLREKNYGLKIEILSDLLQTLYTSQFEGAEYEFVVLLI